MTDFVKKMVAQIADDGMTEDLWQLVQDDFNKFLEIKVSNERERNLYFYLENFIDDLCYEFKCGHINKKEIISNVFNRLRSKEKIDLTDIRKAVFDCLRKKTKIAYPNTRGVQDTNSVTQYDVEKWVKTLTDIYSSIRVGENYNTAFKNFTEEWSPMEKINFESWVRYYENGDHEKYNITKSAQGTIIPSFPKPTPEMSEEMFLKRGPGRPKYIERTLEQDKQALVSRLDSATKLLRRFVNIWPPEIWQRLSEILSDLQREIIPLKTTATIIDCIYKTANKLNRIGLHKEANTLFKVAEEGGVASQIERALSGKEPKDMGGDLGLSQTGNESLFGGGTPPDAGAQPPADMPMPSSDIQPAGNAPIDQNVQQEMEMAPPAGVEENLPPPVSPPPTPEPEKESQPKIGENPFDGQNISIKNVIEALEPISKQLSEREFARSLSKIDMMLDSLNIASHFPELSEALSKAFELNTYIGARVDKIINKLKGGLKGEDEGNNKDVPPEIDMGEFSKAPGNEKVMFEVSEEPKPEAPAPTPLPTKGPTGV